MGLLDTLRSTPAAENSPSSGEQTPFAPAWRWEQAGDGVEGIVVAVDSRVNDNNPEGYPIVTLRQTDGTDIAVHGFATVLKNEITSAGLRPGDTFAAIYDGKKMGGAGRQYHAFRVMHVQGQGAPVPPPAVQPAAPAAPAVPDPWDQADDNNPPF